MNLRLLVLGAALFGSVSGCRSRTSAAPVTQFAEGRPLPPLPTPAAQAAAPELAPAGGVDVLALAVPELGPPYTSGPLVRGDREVRRFYRAQGKVTVEVVAARQEVTDDSWADWTRSSRGQPAADLGVSNILASGVFNCVGSRPTAPCDAHVLTRSGYRLDLLGHGSASREALQALTRELPWPRLTAAFHSGTPSGNDASQELQQDPESMPAASQP